MCVVKGVKKPRATNIADYDDLVALKAQALEGFV
jgi:hypothetical protein